MHAAGSFPQCLARARNDLQSQLPANWGRGVAHKHFLQNATNGWITKLPPWCFRHQGFTTAKHIGLFRSLCGTGMQRSGPHLVGLFPCCWAVFSYFILLCSVFWQLASLFCSLDVYLTHFRTQHLRLLFAKLLWLKLWLYSLLNKAGQIPRWVVHCSHSLWSKVWASCQAPKF